MPYLGPTSMPSPSTFEPGQHVRVKKSCPLTLPHYARVLPGVVEGFESGSIVVRFGEDRFFPLPPEWLENVEPAPAAS